MTLKKSKTDGQSAVEYFILTIIIVALLFFFNKTGTFKSIRDGLDAMFNTSVDRISGKASPASSPFSGGSSGGGGGSGGGGAF